MTCGKGTETSDLVSVWPTSARSMRVTADLKGRDRGGPLRGCLPEIRYTD
jgi:hypothetical protein